MVPLCAGPPEFYAYSRVLLDLLQQPLLIRLAIFDGPDGVQGDGGAVGLLERVEERLPPRSNFANDWVAVQ